jgi:polysaccharide biosynthesis/export protein
VFFDLRQKYYLKRARVIFCLLFLAAASIQAATPSAQQLELLSQLSPAQQAQLLQSLKKAPNVSAAQTLEQPEVVVPANLSPVTDTPAGTQTGVDQTGVDNDLQPFGYDLFAGAPTTFSPVTEIPIPVDYVIGPGDTVQVQLFGKENQQYELLVDREGGLQFPGIGPIAVTGMRFDELKQVLKQRINKHMLGVQVHVSLGELRSMRIFVLGDVNRPGAFTVSSLSTMTNALFVSGGVRPIGSLRNVQLKRRGKLIQQLDLYDLLLHGDTSSDVRMQPGDVIFVPPIGNTVGVAGEVRRPAIYELKKEHTVKQALAMAGGLLPTAYQAKSQLERINSAGEKSIIDIDLSSAASMAQMLKNGDLLNINSVLDKMEDVVFVSGHVQRPGEVQWQQGMRLSEVLPSIKALLPEPDLRLVLVRRERQPDRMIEVLASRLDRIFIEPDSNENLVLQSRDRLLVFGLSVPAEEQRDELLQTLLQELRQQASEEYAENIVQVVGDVRWPGEYPLAKSMRLRDLLRFAGGITMNSDTHYVLLMQRDLQGRYQSARSFDLTQSGDAVNPALTPRDEVYVFAKDGDRSALLGSLIMQIKQQATSAAPAAVIRIGGLVKSAGEYPLESNMGANDLLRAAGGLTESAYTLEAELSRYSVDKKDGRRTQHIVLQLPELLSGNVDADVVLQSYDSLHIKRLPNWTDQRVVEVIGEVRFPGSYPVKRGETLLELLERAGGLNDQAFAEGAVFLRESLRKKEQDQIDVMSLRLESDLAAIDLEKAQVNDDNQRSVGMASSLLQQLKTTKAVGRLVIDLPLLLASRDDDEEAETDILLKDGDQLMIPAHTQEVTILGEVQHATSHLFREGRSVQHYISSSGGMTYRADEDRVYVVRANGAVLPSHSADWFGDNLEVRPGDTIIVPLDAERMKPLTLWTNISQIVYQIGIAAASWNAVGLF